MLVPGFNFLINYYIARWWPFAPPPVSANKIKLQLIDEAQTNWIAEGRPAQALNERMYAFLLALWNADHPPTSNYQAVILADNPLGYWRLDDAAGTVAANLGSGTGPGTYIGGPVEAAGIPRTPAAVTSGLAVTMKGAPDPQLSHVDLPPSSFSALDFSFEMWFRVPLAYATTGHLLLALPSGGGPQINLQVLVNPDASLTAHRRNAAGVIASFNIPALTRDVWHHIVYTRLAGVLLAIYLDGALARSSPDSVGGMSAATSVTVGGDPSGTKFSNGMIDEVAVYATALTSAQIAAHYAARL